MKQYWNMRVAEIRVEFIWHALPCVCVVFKAGAFESRAVLTAIAPASNSTVLCVRLVKRAMMTTSTNWNWPA